MHSFLTVVRLVMMLAGVAAWQRAQKAVDKGADSVDNLQEESATFDANSRDLAAICLWVLTIVGLILDLLCLKWLRIASLLFYLELLHTVLTATFPNTNGIAAS